MKTKTLIIVSLLALCATGCTPNLAKFAKELSKDPAIVNAHVQTVYGTVKFTRIGVTTNSITINPDGTVTVNRQ